MKQQIIELKKKLLLVELPEGANRLQIFHDIGRPYISYFHKDGSTDRFYLEEDVKVIGKPTDITEQQFEEWVDTNGITGYYNYVKGACCCNTAKESFFSKLEAEEIYFSNPIQKPGATDHKGMKDLNKRLDKYYEAEKKVWNRNNTYVFEIL